MSGIRETPAPVVLTDTEWCILETLAGNFADDFDWWAYTFKGLARETGKPLDDVKTACRSLRQKGFAQPMRGLMTEDGEVAGSGYTATKDGKALCVNRFLGTLADATP